MPSEHHLPRADYIDRNHSRESPMNLCRELKVFVLMVFYFIENTDDTVHHATTEKWLNF